jgi:hypothetical protein
LDVSYSYRNAIHNSQEKITDVSSYWWMYKENVIMYTMKYYSALKKEWNPVLCQHELTGYHYVKWNKLETERQVLYDLTHIWNLKNLISNKLRIEEWLIEAQESVGEKGWGKVGLVSTTLTFDTSRTFWCTTAQ